MQTNRGLGVVGIIIVIVLLVAAALFGFWVGQGNSPVPIPGQVESGLQGLSDTVEDYIPQ